MSRWNEVGKHKTTVYNDDTHKCVKYHKTNVVRFNNKEIILNNGGWMTATTKLRMNQASNQFGLGYHVWQKDFEWFVTLPNGEEVEFEDGMKIKRR